MSKNQKRKITGADRGIKERLPLIPPNKVIEDGKHRNDTRRAHKKDVKEQEEEYYE